jgi:20S proteasome alpha/beta subunit
MSARYDADHWKAAAEKARRRVTVRIAVWNPPSSTGAGHIVLCADWRISGLLGRSDTMFKIRHLGPKQTWRCLTAGNPNDIRPTVRYIDEALSALPLIDETNLLPAVSSALNRRRLDRVNEYCQGHFSMTYDAFIQVGKIRFPEAQFNKTSETLEDIRLDAEFIVAGFNTAGTPFVVRTTDRGGAVFDEGFSIIGEGNLLAQAVLMQRQVTDTDPLDRQVYCSFEAKKYAEALGSVSGTTTIMVLYPSGQHRLMSVPARTRLAELYALYGPKELPRDQQLIDPTWLAETKPAEIRPAPSESDAVSA